MKYTIGLRPQWTGSLRQWTYYVRDDDGRVVATGPAREESVAWMGAVSEGRSLKAQGHEVSFSV